MAASTALSGVMERVAFVQKLPMIIKATSDDDTPTAGYLYQEISELTYISSGYCKSLLDVLVDRLDKSSHHVKFKVLRVMKHVVENGSDEFRSGLLRRSSGIQLATKFSGPPDPLHGNAPYIAVRTAAKELSEILFDTEQTRSKDTSSPRKVASSGGLVASRNGSNMQGFGNTVTPVHKQKSFTETIKGGFQHLADSFRESTTPPAYMRVESDYKPLGGLESDFHSSAVFSLSSGKKRSSLASDPCDKQGEYKPVVVVDDSGRGRSYQPGNRDLGRVTAAHKQGKPAGGWEDSPRGRGSNASNSDGQQSGDSTELSERLESVSVEDLSLETKLVEDFVIASDGKPTPSRDALAQFVKCCSTLNCEKVTELLVLELRSTSDSIQMRCLCALEALMREDIVSADHLLGFLPQTLTTLQTQSTDRLVQSKASKILRQLERTHQEATIANSTNLQHDYPISTITDPIIDIPQTVISSNHQTKDLDIQESLVVTSPVDRIVLTTSLEKTLDGRNTSSRKTKSLFSGMEIGSPLTQTTNSESQFVQTDESVHHESHGGNISKSEHVSSGHAQLLDELLDLSSTDQPTLVPNMERNTQRNLEVDPLPLGDAYHSLLQFNTTTNDSRMSQHGNESDAAVERSENGNTTGRGTRLLASNESTNTMELVDTTPKKQDSIMSRQANLDDLLADTGITINTGKTCTSKFTASPSPRSENIQPTQSRKPVVDADQISRLYPQLTGVSLSGSTAVPLKLGERPPDGNFAFIVTKDGGGKENSKRVGSFDFVKDAMMNSKK